MCEVNLSNGWATTSLEKVCAVVAGNPAPQGEEFFENGIFNFVRVQDMGRLSNFTYLSETKDRINERAIPKLRLFPKGSVLFTKSGASTLNNQRAILRKDCYVVSHIAAAIPEKGISSEWIYFTLLCVDFADLAHSSVMPSLPLSKIKPIQVLVPPTNEQHRIVAKIEVLFSDLDEGIARLKTARAQLAVYRQALLKHAFEGKLTEQWRKENAEKLEPAETLLTRIKQEREARYQQQVKTWRAAVDDWELKRREGKKPAKPKKIKTLTVIHKDELKEFPSVNSHWTYIRLGNLIDEPKYGTSKKCEYEIGGTGVLRIPNIVSGIIDSVDLKFAHFNTEEVSAYSLKEGDILVIRSNGSVSIVGKSAHVTRNETKYLYAGYLIRLRCNEKMLDSHFLSFLLTSHLLRKQIEYKAKSTSGVNNINSGELQSLIVPITNPDEQQIIVRLLEEKLLLIDRLENEIEDNLRRSEALRQSILKKAFSGQLVPQDPNDKPASILLECIKAERIKQAEKTKPRINKKTRRHDV